MMTGCGPGFVGYSIASGTSLLRFVSRMSPAPAGMTPTGLDPGADEYAAPAAAMSAGVSVCGLLAHPLRNATQKTTVRKRFMKTPSGIYGPANYTHSAAGYEPRTRTVSH